MSPSSVPKEQTGRARRLASLRTAALGLGLGLFSCNYNAYTVGEDIQLGTQAFTEVAGSEPVLNSGPQVAQVQRVTDRLVASAQELKPGIAPLFAWEVVVIDRPEVVNAFCLPGGKMAVYTGILSVAQGDAGLAVVMGHEIAHATERHGTERLSRNGLLGSAITVLVEDEDHQGYAQILANLGIGMPWGRNDELEADREGLMILANAGYDPREAPRFWERMAVGAGGPGDGGSGSAILAADSIEEFLSTHPSNQRRIDQLKAAIPAAMPLYEAARAGKP
jgi:predicted Zn-dependent protease